MSKRRDKQDILDLYTVQEMLVIQPPATPGGPRHRHVWAKPRGKQYAIIQRGETTHLAVYTLYTHRS